jgi:hypothetical protein
MAEWSKESPPQRMPFVLTDETFVQLAQTLAEANPALEYTVNCSDGSSFTTEDPERVSRFPNPNGREIRRIGIRSKGRDGIRIRVHLRADFEQDPFSYEISGDESALLALSRQLDEFRARVRPWYPAPGPVVSMLPSIGAGLLFTVWLSMLQSVRGALAVKWGVFVLLALLAVLPLIWKRLYPIAVFAMGTGKDREAKIRLARNVVSGLFLSLIGGLLGRLLWLLITGSGRP